MRTLILTLALLAAVPQQPTSQTPSQLVSQIDALVQQLKSVLGAPTAATPPATVVTDGASLTSALRTGGAIALKTGTYAGNFVVSQPTVLTGPVDAVLTPADLTLPALQVTASNVTVTGIGVVNGDPGHECVVVGSPTATTVDAQPHHVRLDGLTITAGLGGGHRGVAMHGVDITLTNSRVLNFWRAGQDAQAVWINNGPGPYAVTNNILSASGENILVGGDSVHIPNVVPADITISGNTLTKPDAWRTNGATVKNAIELKLGLHVTITDNTIDGNWASGQDGTPVVFTVRNQNADNAWALVDDVTFARNVTKRCTQGYAVSILGSDDTYPSQQTQTISLTGNLFTDSPAGVKLGNGVAAGLTIDHNTFPAITANFLAVYDSRSTPVLTPLTFTNNVLRSGSYGATAACCAPGTATLTIAAKLVAFIGNVIERTAERTIPYPVGNTLVAPGGLAALLNPTTFKLLTGTAGY